MTTEVSALHHADKILWALAVKLDRDRNKDVGSCHAESAETVVSKDAETLRDSCFPPTAKQIPFPPHKEGKA